MLGPMTRTPPGAVSGAAAASSRCKWHPPNRCLS